ncbi:FkbM family methyltransferase [Methanospirillum sp. J.3.6.1-F.2.7.3]|uniref:FkbM family methyltransferase n=1 Tax=Methanospirillum purgamenti TaxID=2834276 RepID=A0A8E7EJI4_9EURY|nr:MULTISPECIES: FkbM family methyltransferase [Methanospirillum]MDX8551889.1 FkbM family methyltransferase [Methanospirillum hungatei]QVV89159.1 FkbM family methyltransferase [Methanospirillum sp. J.3.6.1-F.2.7.3]
MYWKIVEETLKQYRHLSDFSKSSKIALFGAGPYGSIGAEYLKNQGYHIKIFSDNNPDKQGIVIDGIPVVPPDSIHEYDIDITLITAHHAIKPIQEQLHRLKIPNTSYDSFFISKNMNRLEKIYHNYLKDDRSREVYSNIILSLLTGSREFCINVIEKDQYFALPQFRSIENAVFIDAGAYVGDTIEQFFWINSGVFSHIYAFEPGELQYRAMERRIQRLKSEWAVEEGKITLVKGGLGKETGHLEYSSNNYQLQSSSFVEKDAKNAISCPIYSLDQFLEGRPITFIKSDIEGMEKEMLVGASESIKKYKPRMALSIYHRPEDLFQIAEYVHELVSDYKMAVRHHSPSVYETVLYCWVE